MSSQQPLHDRNDDAALDTLLSRHLSDELEPHIGAATRRFEQYAGPGPVTTGPLSGQARRLQHAQARPSPVRLWWTAPLLAAAAAVAMIVVPVVRMMSRPQPASIAQVAPTPPNALPPAGADAQPVLASHDPQVQGAMWSEYRDAGRVYLDDQTVARRLVKTDYQRLQWTDPSDHSQVEITIPRQEVVLVSSPKF